MDHFVNVFMTSHLCRQICPNCCTALWPPSCHSSPTSSTGYCVVNVNTGHVGNRQHIWQEGDLFGLRPSNSHDCILHYNRCVFNTTAAERKILTSFISLLMLFTHTHNQYGSLLVCVITLNQKCVSYQMFLWTNIWYRNHHRDHFIIWWPYVFNAVQWACSS